MKRHALLFSLPPILHGFPIHPPHQSASHPRSPCPLLCTQRSPKRASGTRINLLKGLQPTIDDDINDEIAEASLSPLQLFQRELSSSQSILAALMVVMKRQKDKAGDYENKYKILSDNRSYSDRILLDKDHVSQPPKLDDLNQKQPRFIKVLWVRSYFRMVVFLVAFFAFPYLCQILNAVVVINEDEFDIINGQFTPGIGILYGTFVALTLDILYERQGKVQENASVEASLLSQTTQNILSLFRDEEKIAREATQIIADQVRIIVYRSRGAEMLNIMRSDPYSRLLSLVDRYQRSKDTFTPWEEALIDGLRGEMTTLMEARARRLSDEASALPPTHFLVLSLLTALSLIGFTAATITISDSNGNPPLESRMVFAGLAAIYVLFFNFSNDMNDPFDGVYQIKRSSAASYLLQIKWLVSCQSWGGDIRFDTRGAFVPEFDGEVLEVVGRGDGESSLGLTMKRMESVERAMTSAATKQTRKQDTDAVNYASENTSADDVAQHVIEPTSTEQVALDVKESMESETIDIIRHKKTEVADTTLKVETKPTSAKDFLPNKKRQVDTSIDAVQDSTPEELTNKPLAGPPQQHGASVSGSHLEEEPSWKGDEPKQAAKLETTSKPSLGSIQKEQVSHYFRTLSGFREDNLIDALTVSVPLNKSGQSSSGAKSDRQTIASAYFRSVGGFIH